MFRPEIREEKFETPGPVLENGNEKTMVLIIDYHVDSDHWHLENRPKTPIAPTNDNTNRFVKWC